MAHVSSAGIRTHENDDLANLNTQLSVRHQVDVLVLGAGISGLAAAAALKAAGLSVLVLEGRERIGGRLHSVPLDASTIDLGAAWIHGNSSSNPIAGIAAAEGLQLIASDAQENLLHTAAGEPVTAAVQAQYEALYDEFEEYLAQLQDNPTTAIHMSVQEARNAFTAQKSLSKEALLGLDFMINTRIEQEYGADAAELSAKWYNADEPCEGDDMLFPNGYCQIPEAVTRELHDVILLQHTVVKVSYDQSEPTPSCCTCLNSCYTSCKCCGWSCTHFSAPACAVQHAARAVLDHSGRAVDSNSCSDRRCSCCSCGCNLGKEQVSAVRVENSSRCSKLQQDAATAPYTGSSDYPCNCSTVGAEVLTAQQQSSGDYSCSCSKVQVEAATAPVKSAAEMSSCYCTCSEVQVDAVAATGSCNPRCYCNCSRVQVIAVTAAGHRAVFQAQQVVVTFPLGMLKRHAASLFDPPLPAEKLAAIRNLGVGLLNKVVLLYDEPFWLSQTDSAWFNRLPSAADHDTPGKGRWQEFFNAAKFLPDLHALVAFNCGTPAWQAEMQTDAQLASEVTNILASMYPAAGAVAKSPQQIIVTRWGTDPFALGSYAMMGVGSSPDDMAALAAPVSDMFFAGEAMSEKNQGTVHGAYTTGQAAARAIIKLRNKRHIQRQQSRAKQEECAEQPERIASGQLQQQLF